MHTVYIIFMYIAVYTWLHACKYVRINTFSRSECKTWYITQVFNKNYVCTEIYSIYNLCHAAGKLGKTIYFKNK